MEFLHHVTGRMDFLFVRENAASDPRDSPGVVAVNHHTAALGWPASRGYIFHTLQGFYVRGSETILSYRSLYLAADWLVEEEYVGLVYVVRHRYLQFLNFTFERCCTRGSSPCYVCTWLDISLLDQLRAMESREHALHAYLPREVQSELRREPPPLVMQRRHYGVTTRVGPSTAYGARSYRGRMTRSWHDDEDDVFWAAPLDCNHADRDEQRQGAASTVAIAQPQEEVPEDPGAEYAEPLPQPGEPAFEFDVPLGQPRPVDDYNIRHDYPRGTVSMGSDSLGEDTSTTYSFDWGAPGSEEGRRLADESDNEAARDELDATEWEEQQALEREWRDAQG